MPTILVVDDDEDHLFTLKEWLLLHDYQVETAETGAKALDLLRTLQFDIIVLDWELPEASGIEITEEFRASGGSTPILMMTGRRELEDKQVGFDAGVDDYLTKPFRMEELTMRIKALLRRVPAQSASPTAVATIPERTLKPGDSLLDPMPCT